MEGRGRRHDAAVWLSSFALWHGARDGERTGPGGSGVRRPWRGAGGARRHERTLAVRRLYRGLSRDGSARASHLRQETVAAGAALAGDPDRHRLRGACLGDAVEDPDGARGFLFGYRQQDQGAEGLARGGGCGRKKSDLLRGTVPSRARKKRRADWLSL